MAEATPKQEYPKWIYHRDGASKIVKTAAEHDQHNSDEWREEPFGAVESAEPSQEGTFYDLSVKDAKDVIAASDLDTAKALLETELAHPEREGGRPSLVKAIEARIAELSE